MIYESLGGAAWLMTTALAGRYVVQPWITRSVVLKRILQNARRCNKQESKLVGTALRVGRRRADNSRTACERLANWLDAVGRELRLGSSLHGALITAQQRHAMKDLSWLAEASKKGTPLETSIDEYLVGQPRTRKFSEDAAHYNFALRTIVVASRGADAVHAVESGARSLRGSAAIAADARSAVSYTNSSVNVLTLIPLLVICWLIIRDVNVRQFLTTTPGAVCLVAGISLNGLGRWLVRRISTSARQSNSELADFIDLITVHLRSANPPALAFANASSDAVGEIGQAARRVVASMDSGMRFVEALAEHRSTFSTSAYVLIDALIDTERDGLPPRELFSRLSADAHTERRRESDRRIRALPVRLSLPLVGCILPAYVLLAVIPLLAAQISSVTIDPL